MSLKALSDYTVYSRYAHYLPEKKRRETWEEITERVFAMHARKYAKPLQESEEFKADFEFAKDMVKKKRVLGSQRALQFGGEWIEKANAKLYNCSFTYVDRPTVFQEIEYLLLAGCGVGFSVQKHHVKKLPEISRIDTSDKIRFEPEDSIQGWADAIGVIVNSYFVNGAWSNYSGRCVTFDYSKIRPEGALIAGQFKAPGHKGLEKAVEKIRKLIEKRLASPTFTTDEFAMKLRPIDVYDIVMFASDSVLSGGIRRSATISLFSHDDSEMMTAKTGNWFNENPQRGRSNNSVLLVRGETTWDQFKAIMESTRQYGEPGFYFATSTEHGANPCVRGDTLILTREGNKRIDSLIGKEVEIWNGYEWSSVIPRITGENQEMLKITLIDGRSLVCTRTHEWLLKNRDNGSVPFSRVEASDLYVGDMIWQPEGCVKIDSIEDAGVDAVVYCFTEHLRNLGTFNDILTAQCVEIGLFPQTVDGRSGVQFCNLCEINGKPCSDPETFYESCRAAAILGTMQAGYTDFAYLSPETKEITEREALLGVSITGVMDNPEVLLSPKIQRAGAQVCKDTNARVAKLLGINAAARITCTKPAGSTSCVLQTASGIHPHHARRYLRRVQANRLEFPLSYYKSLNPAAVETSVWSANGTDEVISFACEVPKGAILKNDLDAIVMLSKIKSSQMNWVLAGENPELSVSPGIHHNISNTITVRDDEWEKVSRYIYDNREYFTGISLLGAAGDLDYPQAPFATVLTPEEIVKEYGEGSILASGLVVDGLHAFGDNLWNACEAALGLGESLNEALTEPIEPDKPKGSLFMTNKAFTNALADYAIQLNLYYQAVQEYREAKAKHDWVRRAKQFAERYFNNDIRKMTYCLKHVSLWHTWLCLHRTRKEVDWSLAVEETASHVDANTLAAQACAGGACLL
jgi:hypothetical protein